MSSTLTTTRIFSPSASLVQSGRLAIDDDELPGIDLEWRKLWNDHGSQLDRADEVTIEEYRMAPGRYSFTYATYDGKYSSLHVIPIHNIG